jgi:hypothetical protein
MGRAEIARRIGELSAEIRAYPTPIARCDVQLGALLEERSQLVSTLQLIEQLPSCSAQALWVNDGGTTDAA